MDERMGTKVEQRGEHTFKIYVYFRLRITLFVRSNAFSYTVCLLLFSLSFIVHT